MKILKLLLYLILSLYLLSSIAAPYCVAHRALGFGEVENSLSAIESAAKAGAEAIEFDLLHTKDNKTIIYHDNVLDRLIKKNYNCPTRMNISDINSTDLKKCSLINGDPIPVFSETMEMLSHYDSKLFIEIKDRVTREDLDTLMRTFPEPKGKIFIISFNARILRTIKLYRRTEPYLNDIKLILVARKAYKANITGLDGIDANQINTSTAQMLKAQGKLTGVYTKNTTREIQEALNQDVDFITTNNYAICEELTTARSIKIQIEKGD